MDPCVEDILRGYSLVKARIWCEVPSPDLLLLKSTRFFMCCFLTKGTDAQKQRCCFCLRVVEPVIESLIILANGVFSHRNVLMQHSAIDWKWQRHYSVNGTIRIQMILTTKRRPFVPCVSNFNCSTGQPTSCVFYMSHSKPILPCHFWTSRFSHFSKHCPTLQSHSLISFLHWKKHCIAQETFSSQGAQGLHSCLPRLAAMNRLDKLLLCFCSWVTKTLAITY